MKYRKLGKTGLEVSEISLGGTAFLEKTLEESADLLNYCHSEGINFLDCWISDPNARSNIGTSIKDMREEWIIQGHFGSVWEDEQYLRTRDMDKVVPAFEDQLKRLQTDYLDIGTLHYVDTVEDFNNIMNGEMMEYARKMKDEGIVHHIGIGTHTPEIALLASEIEDIEIIMFSINPAFDMLASINDMEIYNDIKTYEDKELEGLAPLRAEFYQICKEKSIPIVVMKPFAGGRLLSKETSPFGIALTPIQCIEYALTRPGVATVLSGGVDIDEISQSIAYESASFKDKDYASVLVNAPKNSYDGQCTYCGHCAPCASHIDIAMVNKLYDLARHQKEVPPTVKEHYNALPFNASDCIVCGACEDRCPFNVKIVETMENAKRFFEMI